MRNSYQGYNSDCFFNEWTSEDGKHKFYTVEYDWSDYIDFYNNEAAWKEAIEEGLHNDERVDSLPNFFKDDADYGIFVQICEAFEETHNIRTAIDNVLENYDELWLRKSNYVEKSK